MLVIRKKRGDNTDSKRINRNLPPILEAHVFCYQLGPPRPGWVSNFEGWSKTKMTLQIHLSYGELWIWRGTLGCYWIYIVFSSHGGQYIFDQICKFSHVHFPRENGSVTLGDLITVTGTKKTTISSNLTIFTGRRISVRFHHPPLYLCHQDLPLPTQGFILPKKHVLAIHVTTSHFFPGKKIISWTIKLGMQPWHPHGFTEPSRSIKIKGLQLQKVWSLAIGINDLFT